MTNASFLFRNYLQKCFFFHSQNQFEDLMARFVEFKQPIGLEERAERLSREISDMENSVDELTGVEAKSCKQALDHTNEISRRLVMVWFFFFAKLIMRIEIVWKFSGKFVP